ncbi:hypothetical protein PQR41_24325 [Paraburkholderia xenovorans]|uniref:hypothetical protein n=1 Tax=Paraburkholderia xenovorans TaxID=36873 RepID=UPI0038BDFD9E
MRMILFSSRQYDSDSDTFTEANATHRYELHFQESHLDSETAILAQGYEVVCPFVNDNVHAAVFEEEGGLFFEDHSNLPLQDDVLARLLMFPNVIVTAHQAFFTREAMNEIAQTTLDNVAAWQAGTPRNVVRAPA